MNNYILCKSDSRPIQIDSEDFDWLNSLNWCISTDDYAVTGHNSVAMHRLIMRCPANKQIDHINGNRLDNRKVNLRLATATENARNRKLRKCRISKYKGISKNNSKWRVRIQLSSGERIHVGYYETDIQAALAYDKIARHYFGQFARLNFPNGPLDKWEKT